MHVALTDVLSCPRCGPGYGLILLAHHVEERRVLEGVLGCANCREKYPISSGLAVLRSPAGASAPDERVGEDTTVEGEAVIRVAALMGVAEGPALLLIAGPDARWARDVAAIVEGAEVIAVAPGIERWPEQPGVSRLAVGTTLPFHSHKLNAVYLSGAASDQLLEEAARVTSPIGRLVLSPVPADVDRRLEDAGLRAVARDERALVAVRG